MNTRDERRAKILAEWGRWKSREPVHKKWLIDEFYRWLWEAHPELMKRGKGFQETETWLLEGEGWMG